jgi:predicted nuclease of predicted toxin-antitoxin system
VRFLVDNALSPNVSAALQQAGHDSVHVRDLGMQAAADDLVLDLAGDEQRILISADTDFAALLALRSAKKPSIILFRHGAEHRPLLQADVLVANLGALENELAEGAIVTIEPSRIRVRRLPIV